MHAHIRKNSGAQDEATPVNTHSNWSLELLHEPDHTFVIKVASAGGKQNMQDPQQVCGALVIYECQHLESTSLQQWRNEWPALYRTDPVFAEICLEDTVMNRGVSSSIKSCYEKEGLQVHGYVCQEEQTRCIY